MQKLEPTVQPLSPESNGRLPLPEIQVYGAPEEKPDDAQ